MRIVAKNENTGHLSYKLIVISQNLFSADILPQARFALHA